MGKLVTVPVPKILIRSINSLIISPTGFFSYKTIDNQLFGETLLQSTVFLVIELYYDEANVQSDYFGRE